MKIQQNGIQIREIPQLYRPDARVVLLHQRISKRADLLLLCDEHNRGKTFVGTELVTALFHPNSSLTCQLVDDKSQPPLVPRLTDYTLPPYYEFHSHTYIH